MMGSAEARRASERNGLQDLPQVTRALTVASASTSPSPSPAPHPHPNPGLLQEEIDAAEATNPAGLANLGNTCYLNSSPQCLRAIPEVSTSLHKSVGEQLGLKGQVS